MLFIFWLKENSRGADINEFKKLPDKFKLGELR